MFIVRHCDCDRLSVRTKSGCLYRPPLHIILRKTAAQTTFGDKLLTLTHTQWLCRNLTKHHKTKGAKALAAKAEIRKEIELQLDMGADGLQEHSRCLLEISPEDLCLCDEYLGAATLVKCHHSSKSCGWHGHASRRLHHRTSSAMQSREDSKPPNKPPAPPVQMAPIFRRPPSSRPRAPSHAVPDQSTPHLAYHNSDWTSYALIPPKNSAPPKWPSSVGFPDPPTTPSNTPEQTT